MHHQDNHAHTQRFYAKNRASLGRLVDADANYLGALASLLSISCECAQDCIRITGADAAIAKDMLLWIEEQLVNDLPPNTGEIMAKLDEYRPAPDLPISSGLDEADIRISTSRKTILPASDGQKPFIASLMTRDLTFGLGPAGTGKTFLSVGAAVQAFEAGEFERIILTRPAVEAGERLGFLPGDMKDKVDPFMQPLYDALNEFLGGKKVSKMIEDRVIEISPLAYMRGRTLKRSFVILDEAQNTTDMQMKMFLTRLGEGSRMAVVGDPMQNDLPRSVESGLNIAVDKLSGISEIGIARMRAADVIRHPLVARIVEAYEGSD